MKCNHCQSEVEEGLQVCPECGEVLEEAAHTPDKKKLAIAVALCAALLCALMCIVVGTINTVNEPAETTAPTVEATVDATVDTTEPQSTVELSFPELADRASYTAQADVLHAQADTVVATAGKHTLTLKQLQVLYWMQYLDFLDQYGYYAYMLLDTSIPFDQQTLPDSSLTWEQYFLDGALRLWHRYIALVDLAQEEGFELDQELLDSLAQMPKLLEDSALEGGYASAQEMIEKEMAPGCTIEAYVEYTRLYYTGMSYFSKLYDDHVPADDAVAAYFEEHKAEYETQGVTKELPPYVDVRHILIMPTGGTADASGRKTYSEDEWEACRLKAQGILDSFLAGEATEENFAALANTHSEDGGSNTTGGLYTDVTDDGTYVEAFTAWCMDESRQVGDTGLVKTEYGYHIMYFVSSEEAWQMYVVQDMVAATCTEIIESRETQLNLTVNIDAIAVGAYPVEEPTADATTPTTAE